MRNSVLILSLVFFCQGCGDSLTRVPIQGLVKAQGNPLENATIQCTPKAGTDGIGALGMSDANGNFTVISSRQDDSGIPPGKYGVRISKFVDEKGNAYATRRKAS